jgi:photosystem II stability/assembly factor-like uncharacterized protein
MMMKPQNLIVFLLCFLLLNISGFGQQWDWQHPFPQGHAQTDVFFVNADVGWTSGAFGTILKTEDGGQNWTVQPAPTKAWIGSLFFISPDEGWAITDDQELLYTEDGGVNWTVLFTSDNAMLDIHFVNSEKGFMTGHIGTGAIISETLDGGLSWAQHDFFPDKIIYDFNFLDDQHAWVGGRDGLIVHTEDGGENWERTYLGTDIDFISVSFTDDQNGWAAGSRYLSPGFETIVYHTANGGFTWEQQTVFLNKYLIWYQFRDNNEGYLLMLEDGDTPLQENIVLYRSQDGGNSWENVYEFSGELYIYKGFINDDQNFWLVGDNSRILHSSDDGQSWTDQIELLTTNILRDVHFLNAEEGWVTGGDAILHTTNGGVSWEAIDPGYEGYWQSLAFVDDQNGWIVGDKVIHTANGGTDWTEQILPDEIFADKIFFVDEMHGWISTGYGGELLSTQNGGLDWVLHEAFIDIINDFHFIDTQNGWVINRERIFRTHNGGQTWTIEFYLGGGDDLEAIYFADDQNGWIVTSGSSGVIYRTQNGGNTWQEISIPGASYMYNIHFIDANKGWIVGNGGDIWYTNDGGDTWTWQDSGTDLGLFDIHAVDPANAWAVGFNGAILKHSIVSTPINEVAFEESSVHLYPNPASDRLYLVLPASATSYRLQLINETGQIMANYQLTTSEISIPLNGLPGGLYFVSISNGTKSYSEKLIIIE